jgi:glutamate synthase (NADPH/NADH) large chain
MSETTGHQEYPGLYRPAFEHDSCGFGLIAQMDGEVSHHIVSSAVRALTRMTHRGAVAADGKSGDGCGLLMSKPDRFLRAVAAESGFELASDYAVGVVFHAPGADVAGSTPRSPRSSSRWPVGASCHSTPRRAARRR